MNDPSPATGSALRPIASVADDLGIAPERLRHYGPHIAKVQGPAPERRGKLVLVTALTPTPAGEGKTTVAIGLTQGLAQLGLRAAVTLREPSLGPVFGIKGGGTGGGRAQVLPADEINLHFTGDIHAVTTAINLLVAVLDNHLQRDNALGIDPRRVWLKHAIDLNDRALRHTVVGLGGSGNGMPRESGFELTVASEVMAIAALVDDHRQLRERLEAMRVASTFDHRPVYVRDLEVAGAMTALLLRALEPNLVQTSEGQPAFVHLGPFANIAHGTNSVAAIRMALGHAEVVVTEAGFGSDLGAEKFFNVVARRPELAPDAVVLVATVRALRHHGDAPDPTAPAPAAVAAGLANLGKHVDNVRRHGFTPVLALNRFAGDGADEVRLVAEFAAAQGLPFADSDVYGQGGAGALELATAVQHQLDAGERLTPLYQPSLPLRDKIERIATSIYGADGVRYVPSAERALERLQRGDQGTLPVVIAKTAASLSDDPGARNLPQGFTVRVTRVEARRGAGFVVAYLGDVMTLPGLPRHPASERIDVDEDGTIVGLD